jgi:hypothetical protein
MTPEMQYEFLLKTIPKKYVYLKLNKKEVSEDNELITKIMEEMLVNRTRASEMALLCKDINFEEKDK